MVAFNSSYAKIGKLLSRPVVTLPDRKNSLSWADLMTSSIVQGNTGSGKTTGVGNFLLHDLLNAKSKPGMLCLCVKKDEKDRIERAVKKAGREADLVILSQENNHTVGALEYELYRNGNDKIDFNSALNLIMEVFTLCENYKANGGSNNGSEERFWVSSMELRLLRSMMLLVLAEKTVNFKNIRRLLIDSFTQEDVKIYVQTWEDIRSEDEYIAQEAAYKYQDWLNRNFFLECFDAMNKRQNLNEEHLHISSLVADYFFKEYPAISSKTRSIVDSSITGLLEPFSSGVLRSHFDGEMSKEIMPERCYKEGAIIIVDVPILDVGISAVIATGIMKKLFQLCMQRRRPDLEDNPLPVIFWVDEAHLVMHPNDERFQTICRSTLTACVFLTQSINNVKLAMGASQGDTKAKALLSNLGVQFFCRNICSDTNTYASNLIGKEYIHTQSSSLDTNDRGSHSTNETKDFIFPPEDFVTLKTGGIEHKFKVESILIVGGKNWSTGERYLECTFDQRGRQHNFITRIFSFIKSLFS